MPCEAGVPYFVGVASGPGRIDKGRCVVVKCLKESWDGAGINSRPWFGSEVWGGDLI